MALIDQTTQYIIIIVATLLFTVLALLEEEQNGKNVILQYFAGVMWILSAFAQFVIGDVTSILGFGMSYLFLGFGFLFLIAGFYNSFNILKTQRKKRQQL